MLNYAVRRIFMACLLALFVSFISYSLIFAAGDPAAAVAGEASTAADAERIRQLYGFDQPILVQYLHWLSGVLRGDLGTSLYFDQPVATLLLGRFAMTAQLGIFALILALVIAVPLGVAAGRWPNSIIDRLALLFAVIGQAMPSFWFALLLIILFSVKLSILPASGTASWQSFIMPTIVLGYFAMPAIMRLTRSGMISALEADYIRTARAMGLSEARVLFDYALRNAALPIISLSSAQFGFLLAGSVVVESVFAIHGAGSLAWESIARGDLPTIQALVLCFSLFYVVLTLLADMLNAMLDPRMRSK
ncbi:peptide ABC transporter permease [Mesorhizobium tianshanense]|uniref:Peptide/nickel transport system permease protein n=1 Tax=Mesorhizobium tianshanense TaxID=39844 RepID=A0A562MRU2_9HYPH|nr:ABC transporter permease [Mesorhizobium tianshanense]TWI22301.1 peptide/nickel transport system permease protein [Mesorhizobium tianshanense]GLS36961.1 peptide ABC transporter permease [Mesorhizobium tianshanense]